MPFGMGRVHVVQFSVVMVLPQRGQRLLLLTQVVPQLEHWLSCAPRTGFTGPQL